MFQTLPNEEVCAVLQCAIASTKEARALVLVRSIEFPKEYAVYIFGNNVLNEVFPILDTTVLKAEGTHLPRHLTPTASSLILDGLLCTVTSCQSSTISFLVGGESMPAFSSTFNSALGVASLLHVALSYVQNASTSAAAEAPIDGSDTRPPCQVAPTATC